VLNCLDIIHKPALIVDNRSEQMPRNTLDAAMAGISLVILIQLALTKRAVNWIDFLLGVTTGLIVARCLWVAVENEKTALAEGLTGKRLFFGVARRSLSFLGIMLVICIAAFIYNWLAFPDF
jgi:hypothetical protein